MEQHMEQLAKQEEDSQMTTQEVPRTALRRELYVVISQSLHDEIKQTYLSHCPSPNYPRFHPSFPHLNPCQSLLTHSHRCRSQHRSSIQDPSLHS